MNGYILCVVTLKHYRTPKEDHLPSTVVMLYYLNSPSGVVYDSLFYSVEQTVKSFDIKDLKPVLYDLDYKSDDFSLIRRENFTPSDLIKFVFRHKDKFYQLVLNRYVTLIDGRIPCVEVFPIERTIIDYLPAVDTTDRRIRIRRKTKTKDKTDKGRVYDPNDHKTNIQNRLNKRKTGAK